MKTKTINTFHNKNIRIDWDTLTTTQKEHLIDRIVKKWKYAKIKSAGKKDTLDGTTANAIKQIKDNISTKHKEMLFSGSLYKTVTITWRLIERCKA